MKPSTLKPDWKPWVISLLSLLISIAAFWNSSLTPPDIKVTLGPGLTFYQQNTASEKPPGPNWVPVGVMVIAHCSFANNGANTGEINGLYLKVEAEDGTKWEFAPQWIVDDNKLALEMATTENAGSLNLKHAMSSFFHSIVLPGKQTASYTYLFIGSKTGDLGSPRKLKFTLLSSAPDEREFRQQQQMMLTLDRVDASAISEGTVVNVQFEQMKR